MAQLDSTPDREHAPLALVTGAGRGLGRELARALAETGASVALNFRASREGAESLAAELNARHGAGTAHAFAADVTAPEQVRELFAEAEAHFGRPVTVLVNNALPEFSFNGDARKKAAELDYAAFEGQLAGILGGALATVQAALPGMRESGGGSVINIGTNLFQHPVVPYHDYTAAKAALLSLTRTLAAELGPDGIRVNMVSGGLLRTTDASAATPEAVFDLIAAGTPLRRVTTPAEFADAAVFFAQPASRAVTGQNLIVDGGLVMG